MAQALLSATKIMPGFFVFKCVSDIAREKQQQRYDEDALLPTIIIAFNKGLSYYASAC